MAPPLLEGLGIRKHFGGLSVLTNVGFSVGDGEIVALIGPNGAGKTTLLNLISGVLRPTAGSIRFAGRELSRLAPHRISRLGVARTFQTPRPFPELTVGENLKLATAFTGRPALAPAGDLLALVGLEGQVPVPTRSLTAGGGKLLELAMALALGPRVLLLDEPMAGLTPPEVNRAMALLRQIRDRWGIALVWVEHVMRAVMETADRAVVLHHGEVIAAGPPRAVARDPRVIEAYLGHKGGSL